MEGRYSPPPPPPRFPFPEDCSALLDEEDSDSSRSLLPSSSCASSNSSRRELLRRSVYDPLPNAVVPIEPSRAAALLHSLHLTGPVAPVPSPAPLRLPLSQAKALQTSVHSAFGEHQRVSRLLEDSAKSKTFLIRTLFVAVFALSLLVTALIVGGTALFLRRELTCDAVGEEGLEASTAGGVRGSRRSPYEELLWQDVGQQEVLSGHLMSLFDPDRIRANIRWLSKDVHVAGTDEQLALMDRLQQEYEGLGFDVTPYEYDVLLNYPDYTEPNTLHRWSGADWQLVSDGRSHFQGPPELRSEWEDERARVWWNAYANNGTAIGNVVYANYGSEEDYQLLERSNVSLRGKIALVRYGGVFRGDKAQEAERRGASGVVIFSDPADYAPNGNATFPDQMWLPPSAAQRGTLLRTFGDPQTPGIPSKAYAFREFEEEELRAKGVLPAIPVMPIGYAEAQRVLENLDGPEAMWSRWRGGLRVPYRLTGRATFRLDVRSFSRRRRIKNVCARFRGAEEPDRFVILSNHVDAWVKGAIDPNSGTAVMLETARVVKQAHDYTGWRPRRSLLFCQWDAEEFGLLGSTETVEELLRVLQTRAVAVLNVDNVNGNGTLAVKAVPLLYRSIVRAAGRVAHPNAAEAALGRATLLDAWRFYAPKGPLPGDKSVPAVGHPASGSDHHRFLVFAGVPAADLRLEGAPLYSYMLYHSMLEVPWAVENLLDPSGAVLPAMGKLWLDLAVQLADTLVLPLNVEDYAVFLTEQVRRLDTQLVYLGIDVALGSAAYRHALQALTQALSDFHNAARAVQQLVALVNAGDRPLSLRQVEMLNARLMVVERAFVLDDGIDPQKRPSERHAVFSACQRDPNGPLALVSDPVAEFLAAHSLARQAHWLKRVRLGLTRLQYTVESATTLLQLDGF